MNMSKDISIFPRNFLRQPHVRGLLPDMKLTLLALIIECESPVGCWIPGGINEATNIKDLQSAFDDLEKRGFITVDKKTGEFFICEFFRMNHFVGAKRIEQARDAYLQVRSTRLKMEILEQVELNQQFCKLVPENLNFAVQNSQKKRKSVDNFIDSLENQLLIAQEKVSKEKKREEKAADGAGCSAAIHKSRNKPFAAGIVTAQQYLDQIAGNADLVPGRRPLEDLQHINFLRYLFDFLGFEEVMGVVEHERYPSKAARAARAAGLEERAKAKNREVAADAPPAPAARQAKKNSESQVEIVGLDLVGKTVVLENGKEAVIQKFGVRGAGAVSSFLSLSVIASGIKDGRLKIAAKPVSCINRGH